MATAIGIDVYGTLVDPLGMELHLRPLVGDAAERVAQLWRAKQLEYSFRRAAMDLYENFDVCSRQALGFAFASLGISLSSESERELLEQYQRLDAYPDAVPGIQRLTEAGYRPVAFSNGVESSLRKLLQHAGILPHLNGVVSVDTLKTFKPDWRVYNYLAQRLGCAVGDTWVVSSNPFDVIGAKAAGLKAAWINRNAAAFDPWDIQPDLIVPDLQAFAVQIQKQLFGS